VAALIGTKADVEVFILDEVFSNLPTPPFTPEEKKKVAQNVYAHVWRVRESCLVSVEECQNSPFGKRLEREIRQNLG
jgi:hypothetical protein